MQRQRKQILVIIPWIENIAREIFAGAVDFVHAGHDWRVHQLSAAEFTASPPSLAYFDGIIGRIGVEKLAQSVLDHSSCPVVNVHGGDQVCGLPQVGEDDYAIGVMAADYLYSLGLTHFAYLDACFINSFAIRCRGFTDRLKELGISNPPLALQVQNDQSRHIFLSLKKKLKQLQEPLAVFAMDDLRAGIFEDRCIQYGLNIPEDIAILGVNDDPLFCEVNAITLSSIKLPARKTGFLAAQMLHRLMQKKPLKESIVRVPPEQVIARFSTEAVQLPHPVLRTAMTIIHTEYKTPLKTGEIARRAGVCQRTLEQIFQDVLHCSPQRAIRKKRIEQAKMLLRDTDMPMTEIAEAVGLSDGFYLSRVFKNETGSSPTAYRRKFKIVSTEE